MTLKELERVLYFENYVVIEPGLTPLKLHQLLSEEEYLDAQDEYGEENFTAKIGAEALQDILSVIALVQEREQILIDLWENTSEAKRKKMVKRLTRVEAFIDAGKSEKGTGWEK